MIEWDGRPKSGFHGVKQKECFPSGDYQNKIKVMVFQEESLDRVISIKKKIRKVCNIGHSSIHITDTKEEVLRISELIFNNNGIHFLNYANPYKYHKSNIKNIDNVLKYFEKNKIKQDDILIDSSMLLSLYGLRKNEDIDFLTNKKITSPDEALDAHDSVLKYHAVEKNELIYNSRYYFIYNNIKFVSFDQLFKMKSNRGEEKDIKDCEMMNALIESNDYKKLIAKVKQNIFYFRVRYKKIINLVMVLLLYILVCNIFGVK